MHQICSQYLFSAVLLFLIVHMVGGHAVGVHMANSNKINDSVNSGTGNKGIVDQTDNTTVLVFQPEKFNSSLELRAENKYRYMIETNEISDERNSFLSNDGCVSEHMTVGCCYTIPEVEYLVCVNITYLPHDYGLNFTLRLGDAVFTEEVSLRNPPPMCLDFDVLLPYKIGKLCIKIHNIDVNQDRIHFCAKLIVEVLIKSIYTKELGCVEIPLHKTIVKP